MRARLIALALAGPLAVWACLWAVVPLAGWVVADAGPVTAEAGFTVIVYGAILLAALALGIVARRTGGASLVPRQPPPAALLRGAFVGTAALALAIAYCALAGTLGRGAGGVAGPALLIGIPVVALQVVAEEVMFRGHVQPLLVRGIGVAAAVPLTAALFAALHAVVGGGDALSLGNMWLGGVLFGLLAVHGGGVAPAFGAHFAWNAIEQLGVGLDPNPGSGAFGAAIDLDLSGAALWGGSAAGLNASVAMTIALSAAIAFAWRRRA